MMKNIKSIGWMLVSSIFALTLVGCATSSEGNQFSPKQVLTNALEETDAPFSYYGESTVDIYENGEKLTTFQLKEWVSDDGKRRVEDIHNDTLTITVFDGSKIVSYHPNENKGFFMEDEMLEVMDEFQMSPKKQAEHTLKLVKDTHELEEGEEATIAGRKTYHIKAVAKDKDNLIGDMELWIDKENWVVLKLISTSGNIKTELEYTKIDYNPTFDEDTFTIELPEDVELQDLEGLSETREVTLEEAIQGVGQGFYYIPEQDGLVLAKIEQFDSNGAIERTEVNLNYERDGVPLFFVSVFPSDEELEIFPGEEEISVRNEKGSYMEMNEFRALTWQEEGLNYSAVLLDSSITLDDFLALTETMILANGNE